MAAVLSTLYGASLSDPLEGDASGASSSQW